MQTAPSPALRRFALFTLISLLLVLALRLTMSEQVRETIMQKTAFVEASASGKGGDFHLFIGPAVVVGLGLATALLAAAAAGCGAMSKNLSAGRLGQFAVIAAIIVMALVAAFRAANHFSALVGAVDLSMALLAGWSVSVLCNDRILGDTGRRIVIAALIAILAAWCFKGLYVRFAEMPDSIKDYYLHKTESLKQVGIRPEDDYEVKLFESRLNGAEVSGFISISNVMGEGLIGLGALLAGLLAARLVPAARVAERAPESPESGSKTRNWKYETRNRKYETRNTKPETRNGKYEAEAGQVSLSAVLLVAGMVLLVTALVTAVLTRSRGGATIAIACAVIIPAGAFFWRWVLAHRRAILMGSFAAAALGAAAALAYGLHFDSLPSKSLAFRWDYWAGAAKMIEQAPLTGVGLHNFGDYYPSVKRPRAPEDVTDPHSFFVRIAAEMGIPAAILIGALIAWQAVRATRGAKWEPPVARVPLQGWKLLAACILLCGAWWVAHFFLAEAPTYYSVLLSWFYVMVSVGAAWMAVELTALLSPVGMRVAGLAGLTGAIGMLAYDQINMGIVTGSVAMLFWVLLNLADSYDAPPARPVGAAVRPWSDYRAWIPAGLCAAGGVVLLALVWIPILRDDMPWDSAPYEYRAINDMRRENGQRDALAAIDAAIARAPRSIELRNQRILLKLDLHRPVAEDIAGILALDRANAKVRIHLAELKSDLPPKERAELLEEALKLDDQLPADEIKRLRPAEKERIQREIDALTGRRS